MRETSVVRYISDPKVNSPAVVVGFVPYTSTGTAQRPRPPPAAKDGDAASLGGGRSTDAATVGDVGRRRGSPTRTKALWHMVAQAACGAWSSRQA